MAGMEGLGRVFNVIQAADTVSFDLSKSSAVSLIVKASGASSIALTAAKTFGGSTVTFTPANGFGQTDHWYQATAADGTVGWTKQTAVWTTNSLATAGTTGYVSVVDIFGSQMADAYKYLIVTCTNATLTVITHDLTYMRKPANLAALSA